MGREPKYEVLCKVAKYYQVSTDYLLGLSDYKNVLEQYDLNEKYNELMEMLTNTLPPKGRTAIIKSLTDTLDLMNKPPASQVKGIGVEPIFMFWELIKEFNSLLHSAKEFNERCGELEYLRFINVYRGFGQIFSHNITQVLLQAIIDNAKDEKSKKNAIELASVDFSIRKDGSIIRDLRYDPDVEY